tara:strand:- start:424 stop:813 length:390 start_codon:yes stop_codon:yes gene_type:complete
MPAVLELMEEYPWKWSKDELMNCLRTKPYLGHVVARDYDEVEGFLLCLLEKKALHVPLLVASTEAAVRRLINKLKEKLSPSHRTLLKVEVDEQDLRLQVELRDLGLVAKVAEDGNYLFRWLEVWGRDAS